MHKTEAQFCLDQGAHILQLATECKDPALRDKLTKLAKEWTDRGKAVMTGTGQVRNSGSL